MRMITQQTLGGPEVLTIVDAPKPRPLPTEVLVRVEAIGLNPLEPRLRAGEFPLLGRPPFVLGWDISSGRRLRRRRDRQCGVPGRRVRRLVRHPTPRFRGSDHHPCREGPLTTGRIVSAGSVNLDHSFRVPAIPKPGETLLAESVRTSVGGKSFNQAAAARLLGGDVELVAMVGADAAATTVRDDLRELGIRADRILVSPDEPTGSAFITVDAGGENSIVVAQGANARLTATDAVAEADVVLLALEVPADTVVACARRAATSGAKVVLNLSPYRPVARELFEDCFVVIVNRHELACLLPDAGDDWTAALRSRGIGRAIVTLGSAGAAVVDAGECTRVPAVEVHAVDTTGAGDAFAGAVGYGLARGMDLVAAARLAAEVGAFAATRPGARPSYPTLRQLENWRLTTR